MSDHDPKQRSRLSPEEARTVRTWIIILLAVSTVLIALAPYTSPDADRIISIIATATLATGAIRVRRPTGFRIILAATSLASLLAALGLLHA